MDHPSGKRASASWVTAMIVCPVVIVTAELWITHGSGTGGQWWDVVGLILAIAAGLACLWRLPLRIMPRVLLSIAYGAVAAGVLFFYSLLLLCFVFRDCL